MRHVPNRFLLAALCAAMFHMAAVTLPGSAGAQSPCTCRAAGTSFALDACTCLKTPDGPRVACCSKVLNNTAWRFTAQTCPTARAPVPDARSLQTALAPPARTATAPLPLPPRRAFMTIE